MEAKKHSTIDTVAKKYFHNISNKENDLTTLKNVLTVFFFYEQMNQTLYNLSSQITAEYNLTPDEFESFSKSKKGNIDSRYDSFIASLISPNEDEFSFPKNVNIITWNYDFQFELAFKQFYDNSFENIQKVLKVYPYSEIEKEKEYWDRINEKTFKILHLNGQAHYYYKDGEVNKSIFEIADLLEYALDSVITNLSSNTITFSWERNSKKGLHKEEIRSVIKEAENCLEHAKVLVVIGYSFPFFNRDIDKHLFEKKSFERIYIQDINAKNIKELIQNVFPHLARPDNIIPYENIDQFLLPAELDGDYPEVVGGSGPSVW